MPAILSETPLSLPEAARRLPTHPDPSTVWRWANRGVNGVKLETVTVGARQFTSVQAVDRFVALTNAQPKGAAR